MLYRTIQDWDWYDDPFMFSLWIHLLLEANWKDGEWHGEEVKRGQIITSVAKLSASTGLSDKQVRICLERLVKGGEIEKKTANKWTKITICKYDTYQSFADDGGQTNGKQTANKGQAEGKQGATIEKGNKGITEERKKEKKDANASKEKDEAVENLYSFYPSKCPMRNSSTGKNSKCKEKIKSLLNQYTVEELTEIFNRYVNETYGVHYMMNFGTFLNNLPDYSDTPNTPSVTKTPGPEQQPKKTDFGSVTGFKVSYGGGLLDGIEY